MTIGTFPARPSVLLIDTNLLLVLVIGIEDPRQIERFKRTSAYTVEDFALLQAFVSQFQGLVVTPNVLTEVSNLAGQLSEPLRTRIFSSISALTRQVAERYFPSRDLVQELDFLRLGLTDVSVSQAAKEKVAVLTDDLPLYLKLSASNMYALNFNHIRTGAWEA